jgi:hypothetical protein
MSVLAHLDRKKLSVWAVSLSLAVILIFSWFYLASRFGLSFFVLSNRGMAEHKVTFNMLEVPIWVVTVFVVLVCLFFNLASNGVCKHNRLLWRLGLFGVLSSLIVWISLVFVGAVSLVSLILISGLLWGLCLVFSKSFFDCARRALFLKILFGGLLVGLFFELAAFVFFSVPSALGLAGEGWGLGFGEVELSFANLSNPVLPFFYLAFVLFGVGAFGFRVLPGKWSWLVSKLRVGGVVGCLRGVFDIDEVEFQFLRGRMSIVLALVFSSVISCLFVWLTVVPWNNPTGMLVSVDSPIYLNWINHMRSVDVNSAFSFAIANDRCIFLILCYASSAIIPTVNLIQFVAALLIVLSGVVSLLVLRLLSKNKTIWVLGVLLVPFSFQSLGLIYSGYFANMLALIFVLVYLMMFFRVLKSWSSLVFFAMLELSVLVLFSHSWTWIIFVLSLCTFLVTQWRLASNDKALWRKFKMQATVIGTSIGVGLLSDLTHRMLSPISSTISVLSTAQSSLGFPNFVTILGIMQHAVNFDLGGVFANGLLILLSIVGFIVLLQLKSDISNFFISWIFVCCITILFASTDFVFNRFLFMFPWIILLPLGLFWCMRFVMSQLGSVRRWHYWVLLVFLVFILLISFNSALRFLSNINAW